MANSPGAAPGGTFRVTRTQGQVTEAYITAASVSAAKAAARALPPEGWTKRNVDQRDGQDVFEFNVIAGASDDGA